MAAFSASVVRGLMVFEVLVFLTAFFYKGQGVRVSTVLPPRSIVAVEGVIYCKSCKFPAPHTLMGATPLAGAVARLVCNSSKHGVKVNGTTDKNGYFFIESPKITNYAVHKCKVVLLYSPSTSCKEPGLLNGGLTGAPLRFRKLLSGGGPKLVSLYTVGPLAFAPTNATACTHH